jgi:hypothetical protein
MINFGQVIKYQVLNLIYAMKLLRKPDRFNTYLTSTCIHKFIFDEL